ncbi:sensor histidine kinase [Georgenia faecalis]|uniref:histidine kinase n=1 Tax=Georgenia faecalis TaxID=2483799 RepID=A0ABV9DE66_9MICO|nr:ATP-binding protein [Georgenia faecalis]
MSATHAWTLRTRVRNALVAAGLVLGLVLAVAAVALAQVSREQDQVTGVLFASVVGLEEAHADLVDAEAAVRAYAVTADESTLMAYEALDVPQVVEDLEASTAVLSGDAATEAAVARLVEAIEAWDREYAAPAVARAAAEGPDPDYAESRGPGRELFAEVRLGLETAMDALLDYRADAADSLASWRSVLVGSVVAAVVAALAVGTGLWLFLRSWVTEPLARLASASRAVADGDLTQHVEGHGPQEVVSLGRDVEQMRGRLVAELEASRQARAELEASNRDLEQFAYVASHDLQEPLRKVASFTQLLQRRYGGQLDERADQYIEFAVDGAKRMQRLIQDLLTFSRVGRTGEPDAVVELDACLRDALANVAASVETSGAEVSADPLPEVSGHAVALTQLLQNLVGNALKFRDPERVPRVHIAVERVGEEWVFECRDNGIGIEPRHAERVFVIFQRLHAKEAYGGTGIGLALCKRIVEMHGGTIAIVPRDDGEHGTVVRWTLPVAPARATERPGVGENAPAADGAAPARAPEAQ